MVLLKAVKVFRTEVFDKCCVCASNETKFKIWLPGITEIVQFSTWLIGWYEQFTTPVSFRRGWEYLEHEDMEMN